MSSELLTIDTFRPAIEEIGRTQQLHLMVLYGSHAKNSASEDSDIDIAILGQYFLTMSEVIDIQSALAMVFKSNGLDVKSLHHSDFLFRYQVMKTAKLLYGSRRDFLVYKSYAFRDYVESQDLLRLKERMLEKRLVQLMP